ncbi:MAG: hypothetical protein PHY48_06340 [Candidatus Cloacimonetes bacterium]|nr:hypothetical protein [Candidatus Cloacimonadota bacterium]
MKKQLLFLLILLPLLCFAQVYTDSNNTPGDQSVEEDADYPDGAEMGMSGAIGTVMVGDELYSQVRLLPQINIGKFGFGLDVDLLIDGEGNVRKEDWDTWQDYVNKIYFISWGRRKDPFYFKVGSIPDYTLGHGLIFNHYSNMLCYPGIKNVGAYVGVNTPFSGLGFEAFTHNIHENEVLAGRVHINPLALLEIPLLEKLKIGVNMGIDRNQFGRFEDTDGDNIPDVYDKFPNDANSWLDTDNDGFADNVDLDINGNGVIDDPSINHYVAQQFPEIVADPSYLGYQFDTSVLPDTVQAYPKADEVTVYGLDYQIPLIETDLFYFDNYGEIAKIDGYGTGVIFPGFSSKFLIFDAKLEFRNFGDQFLPGYFDMLYNNQRSSVQYLERPSDGRREWSLTTKEATMGNVKSSLGWFSSLRANIYDKVFVKGAYQDMYGEGDFRGKSLWGSITVNPTFISNLKEATIYYSQTNVNYIDYRRLRNEDAYLLGRVSYALSDNTNLVGRYSEIYNDLNADGRIKGKDEVQTVLTFGVEFAF